MRFLILDADTLLFQEALRQQDDTFEIDPDFPIEFTDTDYNNMVQNVLEKISDILFESGCIKYRAYLSGKDNFRYNFLPSYKWRRNPKPIALPELKQRMLEFTEWNLITGEEADDSCTRDFSTEEKDVIKVLGHIDKDLNQVEGEHFDYGSYETYIVTKEEADNWVWYQVLAGDNADCYSGCPQVGGEISKASEAGKNLTKKERIYNSKAMKIVTSDLCVRPTCFIASRGVNKGVPQLKWEEYHDKKLTLEQRILTWYLKGYTIKGGKGHALGFDTTSGFEDDVKINIQYSEDKGYYFSDEDINFVKNEIAIQYLIAYMLRKGESIPTKLHEINFN